ncbi:MAG: hypothetical protein ABJO09_01375 [Hyphomicrobiales bacterium]
MLNAAGLEAARKFAAALERTQNYSPERMQAYQRNLLEPLLRHARAEVPFYEKRLDPLFGPDDEIRWEAWAEIPTVTREDAQIAGEDMFARKLPDNVGVVESGQTSGSTGRPLKFRTNSLMRLVGTALGERIFSWHGVDRTQTAAFIVDNSDEHPFPEGSTGTNWNLAHPEAMGLNLTMGATIAEQVDWLSRKKPSVLFTYPSNASAVLTYFLEDNSQAPFETVICHGEVLTKEVRQFFSDNGIKIIDRFGASELGPISAECPQCNGPHHQFSEAVLVECLSNESNKQIRTGNGRLIVTPFYNYAMPLIRYENYDHITITEDACSCGRTLPIVESIQGRSRNLFKFPDGKLRWPNLHFTEFVKLLPAKQVQLVQRTMHEIDILYVHDGSSRQPNEDEIRDYICKKFDERIETQLIEKIEISKLPSGKFEDCISLVA